MQVQQIQSKIYFIREERVMLDFDLAEPYEIETRVLNQAVKRNIKRFPDYFMFQLFKQEWESLISQIVISKKIRNNVLKQFKDVYDAINFLLQKEKQQVIQQKRKRLDLKNNYATTH